jgi:hypothetical protein
VTGPAALARRWRHRRVVASVLTRAMLLTNGVAKRSREPSLL